MLNGPDPNPNPNPNPNQALVLNGPNPNPNPNPNQALVLNGLRDRVVLRVDGGLKTARP